MSRISKPPEERRQELIEAARDLFLTQGYDQTLVSDIVGRIGVAQGLFYYYFSSKQDILLAVTDQFIEARVSDLAAKLRDNTVPPLTRIQNLVQVISAFLHEIDHFYPRRVKGMTSEMHTMIHNHVMDVMEPFAAQVLTLGNAEGVLDAPYPAHMARFLLSGFVGVESMPGAPNADEMLEVVLQFTGRLLKVDLSEQSPSH